MQNDTCSGSGTWSLMLFVVVGLLLSGCAAAPVNKELEQSVQRPVSEYVKADVVYAIDAYDPWEGMNRRIYKFNAKFDKYIFLPVVSAYEFITPDFIEDRITNFFNNLGEVTTLTNSLLQFKGNKFFLTAYRVLINSTVGLLGLFDPATKIGLVDQDEDFGQTLGVYGIGNGPYLVLPIFGPSTLRDTSGLAVDSVVYSTLFNEGIDQAGDELDMSDSEKNILNYGLSGLRAIDARHKEKFRYYETGSPFEYDLVRMIYLKARAFKVAQ